MSIIDVSGFADLPNEVALVGLFNAVTERANVTLLASGDHFKTWITVPGETPGRPLSTKATELLTMLVKAGGLYFLFNEETNRRPKGAFGRVSICVGLGLVLPEADGSVNGAYVDMVTEKYAPIMVANAPHFLLKEFDHREPAINAPAVAATAKAASAPAWGGAQPAWTNRLRVVRDDVN